MVSGLEVAVLANLRKNAPPVKYETCDCRTGQATVQPPDAWGDLDSEKTVQALIAAFEARGHQAYFLEGNISLAEQLAQRPPDIAYNLCEGHWGDSRESQIPAILEMLGIPYTGSKVMTLAVALNKTMTKRVLQSFGLPTAPFQVCGAADEPIDQRLMYPLFVKPNGEGTSMGIDAKSIVWDEIELRERLHYTIETYRQPALVEHYIEGREFTVGILGNTTPDRCRYYDLDLSRFPWKTSQGLTVGGLHVFPPMEIDLTPLPEKEAGLYSHHVKDELLWAPKYLCPAPINSRTRTRLQKIAAATFSALGCLDIARVDFRIDKATGKPYVLEINTIPGVTPVSSDMVMIAEADGMDYTALVNAVLDLASARYHLKPSGLQLFQQVSWIAPAARLSPAEAGWSVGSVY